MIILFSFAIDTTNNEATFSGNIDPLVAAQLLQGLAIANAIEKGKNSQNLDKVEVHDEPGST